MNMRISSPRGLIILICMIYLSLIASTSSVFGQVGRASITGIVRDQTGSVVQAVSVTAVHLATGVSYQTTTNDEGVYTIGALPVGQYKITFSVAGFKEVIREGVTLTAGQIARIDPSFEVGAVTE